MDKTQSQWIVDPVVRLYYYEEGDYRVYQDGRRVPMSSAYPSSSTPRVLPDNRQVQYERSRGVSSALPAQQTSFTVTSGTTKHRPTAAKEQPAPMLRQLSVAASSTRKAAQPRDAVVGSQSLAYRPGRSAGTLDAVDAGLCRMASNASKQYRRVRCLVLHWENAEIEFRQECIDVRNLFKKRFGFEVADPLQIPSHQPEQWLRSCLNRWLEQSFGDSELLIVYYSGHGKNDGPNGGLQWYKLSTLGSPKLYWNEIQEDVLFPVKQDVLLLLDCCYAAATRRGPLSGRKEALVACEADVTTPIKPSFTFFVVRDLSNCPLPTSTTEIYARLCAAHEDRRANPWLARRPVYVVFPCKDTTPIELRPLGSGSQMPRTSSISYDTAAKSIYDVGTQIMIPVRTAAGNVTQQIPVRVEEARFESGRWQAKLRGEGPYQQYVQWTPADGQQSSTVSISGTHARPVQSAARHGSDEDSEEEDAEDSDDNSDGE